MYELFVQLTHSAWPSLFQGKKGSSAFEINFRAILLSPENITSSLQPLGVSEDVCAVASFPVNNMKTRLYFPGYFHFRLVEEGGDNG